MHKTCVLMNEDQICGMPATHEIRFQDDPKIWSPSCVSCLKSRRGNAPFIVILEDRPIHDYPGPTGERCELEGDTDPCGGPALVEVFFPDFPADGWLKACGECIDRRMDVIEMKFRTITKG